MCAKSYLEQGITGILGAVFLCLLGAAVTGFAEGQIPAPAGTSVEMLSAPEKSVIRDLAPEFGWEVCSGIPGGFQEAYQIQVREPGSGDSLLSASEFCWDSGKVFSGVSANIEFGGDRLKPGRDYEWRVRIWGRDESVTEWSEWQEFSTAPEIDGYETSVYPLESRIVQPVCFSLTDRGFFYDFGKAAFGTVRIRLPLLEKSVPVIIRFAEKLSGENILDSDPPGTVRYREVNLETGKGSRMLEVRIPADKRNTGPAAVLMPGYAGEVVPFRYCEIISPGLELDQDSVVMKAVNYPFDDTASAFTCSDEALNRIWELCKYSIKATSFLGIYVDGDRERIAYEADAYINQLGHYLVDREYSMARATHEYLLFNPTWPTEWILHSLLIAWEDYLYTGNLESAEQYYEDLKQKTLTSLEAENGLISTAGDRVSRQVLDSIHLKKEMRDIVDWPPGSFTEGGTGERDGHVMKDFNTVVNAFYYRGLVLMSRLAGALGKEEDKGFYEVKAEAVLDAFNQSFLAAEKGIYRDGIGTGHSSLHSNMFPLAFGMVPEERRDKVVEFVKSRGMACSVYGSQYLLDALFACGEDQAALDLLTAEHDRGWLNMMEAGSTVTMEAWDWKYKNNLDWNHAWGAAPANIIPRWILGVRPVKPGFDELVISPRPGALVWARGKVPTIRGPVKVEFCRKGGNLEMALEIPGNVKARLEAPLSKRIFLDRVEVPSRVEKGRSVLDLDPGIHRIRCEGLDD